MIKPKQNKRIIKESFGCKNSKSFNSCNVGVVAILIIQVHQSFEVSLLKIVGVVFVKKSMAMLAIMAYYYYYYYLLLTLLLTLLLLAMGYSLGSVGCSCSIKTPEV